MTTRLRLLSVVGVALALSISVSSQTPTPAEWPPPEGAVRAVEKWRFTPGFRDGEAVPVLISIQNAFTMGKKKPSSADCPH